VPFRSATSPDDVGRRLVAVQDLSRPRISVVVPARNEAANLPYVLAALPPEVYEVVLVDGHSTDDTVGVARSVRPDIRVVQQTRRGKGNALACGFAAVRGDIIVMLDADGSADPSEIARYVDALLAGADFAKGTRFAPGGGSTDLTWLRTAGNRALNLVVNILYGTRYTDLCYGYNAFWTRCLPVLGLDAGDAEQDKKLWGDGFEIETIINTRIARGRLKVVEVPSFELERIHGVSNLNTWRDGFRVLRAALTERLRRRPQRESQHVGRHVIDLTDAHRDAEAATA
jgi:glycosyltransferase involved in cell wall biosynthesis